MAGQAKSYGSYYEERENEDDEKKKKKKKNKYSKDMLQKRLMKGNGSY